MPDQEITLSQPIFSLRAMLYLAYTYITYTVIYLQMQRTYDILTYTVIYLHMQRRVPNRECILVLLL